MKTKILARNSLKCLKKKIKKIHKKLDFSAKMIFTAKDQSAFENAKICWICQKEFGESKKVRDHCHFTGGAAHNICNLQFKKPKFTPVIFHNLSGYDAHLFVKNLGKTEGNIKCIPNNEEKYISFLKDIVVDEYTNKKGEKIEIMHEIRFLDSFKFMASSLENLLRNLAKSDLEKLKETEKSFGDGVKLLSRKGIYPYDYMSKIEKFSETQLPPKEDFYSKLNDCGVSDDDYNHAKKVWKEFGIKNLGEYYDLYLQSDVLLLADVFEEFRNVCMENYSLDPAWYYTSPGLSWDALLKHSGVRLELLTDPDMLLMFEKGIRGGVSMIPNRFGKANNKFMEKKSNPSQPSKFITYLDANNLYGWAMMKALPVGDFKWMDEKELEHWKNIPCILEVDLESPKDLHDLHNDYPLAPERLKINNVEKLIPNLWDKEKYIVHHENHYKYIKPKYGKKAKLLMTDTDSLCYEIETEDFYEDISNDVEKGFDTSNFPKDHASGIQGKNKKVPGMMKDETGGKIIEGFIGLRAKLYSYKMFEGKEEKKCKGIKKCVVKNKISF